MSRNLEKKHGSPVKMTVAEMDRTAAKVIYTYMFMLVLRVSCLTQSFSQLNKIYNKR